MAQIVLGPIVADIAGSIAGTTFQRGPGTHTVRRKPLPTPRGTRFTAPRRTVMSFLVSSWRTLTQVERDAWQSEASAIVWHDRFGNVVPGKGYWLFIRCNLNLFSVDETLRTTPGVLPVFPPMSGLVLDLIVGNKFTLTWSAPDPIGANQYLLISASPPMSPGRSATFGTLRIVGAVPPGKNSPQDFYHEYSTRVPLVPVAGQRSFVRTLFIDKNSGHASPPTNVWGDWV